MRWLLELLRVLLFPRHRPKGLVRPWALSAPVLVLIIALPLLRPIRHPDPRQVSDDEMALLATTQALAEFDTLAIDDTSFANTRLKVQVVDAGGVTRTYADQPPTMAVLLAVSYRVMRFYGLTFHRDALTVAYLLTLLSVTLPAACAAGLVYRMGRLFELRRHKRALLGAAAVFATGLFSYATVLNTHVPAATLVLASAGCLMHLTISQHKPFMPVWLYGAGVCAGLAAAIDLTALPFVPMLAAVVLAYRWTWWRRTGGLLVFIGGLLGPAILHASFAWPGTGDFAQGMTYAAPAYSHAEPVNPLEMTEDSDAFWQSIGRIAGGTIRVFFGTHGLLSHFPVLAIGILGVTMVMHRHWPQTTKVLAAGTLAAAVFILIVYSANRPPGVGWRDAMFAAKWWIVFSPMVLLWAGAWLRRPHRTGSWTIAATLLVWSIGVSVIGALHPQPRDGYDGYTAWQAVRTLWRDDAVPEPLNQPPPATAIATRPTTEPATLPVNASSESR